MVDHDLQIAFAYLKSVLEREFAFGCIGRNFDLDRYVNLNFISSVRHLLTEKTMGRETQRLTLR